MYLLMTFYIIICLLFSAGGGTIIIFGGSCQLLAKLLVRFYSVQYLLKLLTATSTAVWGQLKFIEFTLGFSYVGTKD